MDPAYRHSPQRRRGWGVLFRTSAWCAPITPTPHSPEGLSLVSRTIIIIISPSNKTIISWILPFHCWRAALRVSGVNFGGKWNVRAAGWGLSAGAQWDGMDQNINHAKADKQSKQQSRAKISRLSVFLLPSTASGNTAARLSDLILLTFLYIKLILLNPLWFFSPPSSNHICISNFIVMIFGLLFLSLLSDGFECNPIPCISTWVIDINTVDYWKADKYYSCSYQRALLGSSTCTSRWILSNYNHLQHFIQKIYTSSIIAFMYLHYSDKWQLMQMGLDQADVLNHSRVFEWLKYNNVMR